MKQKILGLFVLFALLVNVFGASADTLSDYQKKYNHLTSKYNSIDASYAAATSNYNAIKNSGDLYEIQKLINILKDLETNAQSAATQSNQYADELLQIGGAQETQLAKDFKWLSVALQNLKDKATSDIAGLEQASEKEQIKVDLQVQYSLLNKLLLKEQELKNSFSVDATIYHIKTLDKAILDMQLLQQLKFDLVDYINLAINNEDKAYAAGETELENDFIEIKYKFYANLNDVKSDEAKLKDFIAIKAPQEISTMKAELVSLQKTVSDLEVTLDKAQCAQDKQTIFKTMTTLNDLAQKDIQEKKSFAYTRANGLAEFSLPQAELYFDVITQYEDLVDTTVAVLNKPFDPTTCPGTSPLVNKAPVFTKVGSQDVKPGVTNSFEVKPTEKVEFTVIATDEDKDVLTYSLENLPFGATFDAAKQTFTWTPLNTQTGSYTLNFKVIDNKGGEAKVSVIVTVSATAQPPANKAPVFIKVGPQDVKSNTPVLFGVKPAEKVEFTVIATDEDKDVLTYSVEGLPFGATFDAAKQTFTWTPTNSQLGQQVVIFKVTDGKGADAKIITVISVSATGQLPVISNKAPIFTKVGSQDVKAGVSNNFGVKPTEKLEFTVTATDEDKDALTYSAENLPIGATFDATKQTFTWTPTNTQTGSYTVSFKVIDGKSGEAKVSAVITVSATGQLPIVLTPQEQTFQDLKNQFDVYEEDFSEYEDNYVKAVKKSETSNINKYKKKLKNLDDDLKSLDDKLDNLLTEVEKLPGMSGLESDIEDKIDDIKSVRQDIKDVLDGKQKTSSSSNTLSTNQVTGATKPVSQEKEVVVEKLPTLPGSVSTFTSEPAEVEPTTSFGMMALLIGGVIVLIAVIVFLLALLLA